MSWRVAKSLLHLRAQVDALAPNRDKGSDGTIGDTNHASRSSDHNPWVEYLGENIVTAMDITHDPRHGVDSYKMADALIASRDQRIKYVISNRRIASPTVDPKWGWRPYHGTNPHDHHVHVSVVPFHVAFDDESDWHFGQLTPDPSSTFVGESRPTLRVYDRGPADQIKYAQSILGVAVDGVFGPTMRAAVIEFQKHHGLATDGIIGPMTWTALQSGR